MEECAYPNLSKQRGRTVLWKLQMYKADEPYNEDMGKNNIEARLWNRVKISEQQYGFMREKKPRMPCLL